MTQCNDFVRFSWLEGCRMSGVVAKRAECNWLETSKFDGNGVACRYGSDAASKLMGRMSSEKERR